MGIHEAIMSTLDGLDLAEVKIKYQDGQKLKYEVTGHNANSLEDWLTEVDWSLVSQAEVELTDGEEMELNLNQLAMEAESELANTAELEAGAWHGSHPSTGVVILRFDSANYEIVSDNHSGDIPSACLALLQQTGVPGLAAAVIDCLTEAGFTIRAFNLVGTNDLVYALVKDGAA